MRGLVRLAYGQGRLESDEVAGSIDAVLHPAWMALPMSESAKGEINWVGHPAWMTQRVGERERWERRLGTAALVRNERRR